MRTVMLIVMIIVMIIENEIIENSDETQNDNVSKNPIQTKLKILEDEIKIIEEKVKESFYQLDDPITQINSFVLNVVRSNAASLTFEDIYTKKTEIAEGVKSTLGKKIADFGYQIIDVFKICIFNNISDTPFFYP